MTEDELPPMREIDYSRAYRLVLGMLTQDHDQIESVFHDLYYDSRPTAELSMDLMKILAATLGHEWVAKYGHDGALEFARTKVQEALLDDMNEGGVAPPS